MKKRSLTMLATVAGLSATLGPSGANSFDIKKIGGGMGIRDDGNDSALAGGGKSSDLTPMANASDYTDFGGDKHGGGITAGSQAKMGGAGERVSLIYDDGFSTSGIGAWPGERAAVSDGFCA